ncbi:MAG: hypothetical protein K1X57_13950 [Gemmataceae bacterium]|nr:hypothetical protein [Gemmataceae bacterium]
MVRSINRFCYLVCLISLIAWVAISAISLWGDYEIFSESRRATWTVLGKAWLTCQIVCIGSALTLRLNKTYFEEQYGRPV